jgi:hypothetical protein
LSPQFKPVIIDFISNRGSICEEIWNRDSAVSQIPGISTIGVKFTGSSDPPIIALLQVSPEFLVHWNRILLSEVYPIKPERMEVSCAITRAAVGSKAEKPGNV